MASPSSVLTRGLGDWGSVNLMVTLGYGIGADTGAISSEYIPGRIDAAQDYLASREDPSTYIPGRIDEAR